MNILFLSIAGLADINDPGIFTDLLRQFRDGGAHVYAASARQKRLGLRTEYTVEEGINMLRVQIGNVTKTGLIEKGISTLRIESQYIKAIREYLSDVKFDLVIYTTPPITFDKVIKYIKKSTGAKSYLLLKDIFPQNAIDLNMINKKGPVYWYFRRKEKNLYGNSDYIGCMSQANVDFILKNNPEINPDIVEVCPNSIEPVTLEKDQEEIRSIRKKYNIPLDRTVFIYGGNLGKPQGIDFLIECLRSNKDNEDVYFIIAGSGTEFNKLKSWFDMELPGNAQLFAQLPKSDYELLANSCDAGLIFLDRRFTIPNFPSRMLSYMQASMPVLAATDVNTDLGKVIEKGRFGFWCESGKLEDFNELVRKLCDEELGRELGANARKYLVENYTSKHSYEIIMNHFK